MLSTITWQQLQEWIIYSELEPFDEDRADLRAAQIVTMLANVNRNPKKRRRPYTIKDFVLRFGDAPKHQREQTWQQMKAIGKMYAGLFGRVKFGDKKPKPKPKPTKPVPKR